MPEIKNTFLKSKMNKDLDDRLIPNGEYRDAQNLQISRSEGSSVGEFENIPGNLPQGYLNSGSLKNTTTGVITSYAGNVIGQHTDETNGDIFIFSTSYTGTDQQPRDITVYTNPGGPTIGDSIALYDVAGVLLNPLVLGVEIGMALWGAAVDGATTPGDIYVTAVSNTAITISWNPGGIGTWPVGTAFTIGWCNTIHRWNVDGTLDLLVRGSFLNFSAQSKIYGTNLIERLLFWTDNRNQPRRINVDSAIAIGPTYYTIEDQVSVAKYYPYEVPLVLNEVALTALQVTAGAYPAVGAAAGIRGFEITLSADPSTLGVKIGDIVTGFPDQGAQELWEVIWMETGGTFKIVVYNNFLNTPGTAGVIWGGGALTFSSPTMTNESEVRQENGFDTTCAILGPVLAGAAFTVVYDYNNITLDPSPQPTPKVGDYITSLTMTGPSGVGITIADEVIIQSITTITPGTSIVITLTKPVTVNAVGDDVVISANPNYNSTFTGDPDLIEEKFVRFSYRFKFADNEYSLTAPFSQICFIPKQEGIFGGGPNESGQDMIDTYTSTIVQWFENRVNNIGLKIPLPLGGIDGPTALTSLQEDYQIKGLEILYRESDGLSTKILEYLNITEDIQASSINPLPSTSATQFYYTFDYKSIKPYKTLPSNQETRVYDKVPIKALAQEVIASRITYGNFIENHTPPASIDYSASYNDKSLAYNNYVQYPNHSVKQNRNYQVGFILSDRYGRQSSVILSSNDNDPTANGSTIYVPYKDWDDVQTSALSTYEWLGSCLRVIVNNGIAPTTQNTQTGEPGLYKAYSDTGVDKIEIASGGVGYNVGDIITTQYPAGNVGLGSLLTYEVVSEAAGVITGIKIVTSGSGYANGQTLNQNTVTPVGGTGAQITVTVNPVNVLGWQSYKFVVKQQEQEYYNVYLPGFVNGYPVTTPIERGRIAGAILLSDNINKVPRDLNEVGPLQNEFSASVELYGRVNNPNIDNKQLPAAVYYNSRTLPWNTQYFPGRTSDIAYIIGPAGSGGLEMANSPFEPGTGAGGNAIQGPFYNGGGATAPAAANQPDFRSKIPWGIPGAQQSFYNIEQNPLLMGIDIGSEDSQPQLTQPNYPILNTLGAYVTNTAIPFAGAFTGCMVPFLSVSETAPVESEIEIFWESSTSGDFVELNKVVLEGYAGVSGVSTPAASFGEDEIIGNVIMPSLKFLDIAGNILTLDGLPVITQILDGNGIDVTLSNPFTLDTVVPATYNDFEIQTNQLFWYGTDNLATTWTISLQTSFSSGDYIDTFPNIITLTLTNITPDTLSFNSVTDGIIGCSAATIGFTTLSTSFGTFTGKNGSVDTFNDTQELCWTLALTSAPGGSTATFGIDSATGAVTKTGGTLIDNSTYRLTATLTDAAIACVTSPGSLSNTCWVDIVIGTPDIEQVLCFGPTSAMALLDTTCNWNTGGTGYPIEVFFGANKDINNSGIGALGSKTDVLLTTIDTSTGSAVGYIAQSGGNLRYYNALDEARYGAGAWSCGFPIPSTPLFTTGALTQGVFAIEVNLDKGITAASPSEYKTNFTILYRANSAAAWQLATCEVGSPSLPAGGVISNFEPLTVSGAGSTTQTRTYHFTNAGEYVVRNNGVYNGNGCTVAPGCYTCAEFTVNFYDATENPSSPGWVDNCTNCTGPL